MKRELTIILVAFALVLFYLLTKFGSNSSSSNAPTAPSSAIASLANAIANAENVPSWANNPGAIALGDKGNGVLNSAGVTVFSTIDDGLNALYAQLQKVFSGSSNYYSPSMTIAEFAQVWTGGDNSGSWAQKVASQLGVSVDTPLSSLSAS